MSRSATRPLPRPRILRQTIGHDVVSISAYKREWFRFSGAQRQRSGCSGVRATLHHMYYYYCAYEGSGCAYFLGRAPPLAEAKKTSNGGARFLSPFSQLPARPAESPAATAQQPATVPATAAAPPLSYVTALAGGLSPVQKRMRGVRGEGG